jgi:hypothetical protein
MEAASARSHPADVNPLKPRAGAGAVTSTTLVEATVGDGHLATEASPN